MKAFSSAISWAQLGQRGATSSSVMPYGLGSLSSSSAKPNGGEAAMGVISGAAEAAAAAGEVGVSVALSPGTTNTAAQRGHLIFLPSRLPLPLNFFWHLGQVITEPFAMAAQPPTLSSDHSLLPSAFFLLIE